MNAVHKSVIFGVLCFPLSVFAGTFSLTSSDFKEHLGKKQVYSGFGCQGGNQSPELSWKGEPDGTKSFAITVYDPDAPTGSGWWHWIIVNIPENVHELKPNAGNINKLLAPKQSIQSYNDFGYRGYGGACPPPGKAHRYVFTVYALSIKKLNVFGHMSGAMVGYKIQSHAINKASITVTYQR